MRRLGVFLLRRCRKSEVSLHELLLHSRHPNFFFKKGGTLNLGSISAVFSSLSSGRSAGSFPEQGLVIEPTLKRELFSSGSLSARGRKKVFPLITMIILSSRGVILLCKLIYLNILSNFHQKI